MGNKTNIKIVPLLISLIFTAQIILVPSIAFAWVKSDGFGADTYNGVMTFFYGEGESPYGESQVYGTGSGASENTEIAGNKESDTSNTSSGLSRETNNQLQINWVQVAAQIRQQLEETNTLSPLLQGLALQMGYVRTPVLTQDPSVANGISSVDTPFHVESYDGVQIPDSSFSFKDPSLLDTEFLASQADTLSNIPVMGSFFSKVRDTIRDNWTSNNSIAENVRNVAGALVDNGRELADAAIDTFVAGVTSAAGAVATAIAGTAGYAMTMAKNTGKAVEQTGGQVMNALSSRASAATQTPQSTKVNPAFLKGIDPSFLPQEPQNTLLDRLMERYTPKKTVFEEMSTKAMEDFARKNSPTGGGEGATSSSSNGGRDSSYTAPPMSLEDYARARASVGSIPNFSKYVDTKVVQTIKNWVAGINGDYVGEALTNLASTIAYYAKEHKVDPLIMTALFTQESGFNPTARSYCGATGIAQFMPETAAGMGVDPYDVTSSINGACEYISNLMKSFGDYSLALAGYNAGGGAVEKYGGIPPYSETVHYVNSITDMWAKLKHQYDAVVAA